MDLKYGVYVQVKNDSQAYGGRFRGSNGVVRYIKRIDRFTPDNIGVEFFKQYNPASSKGWFYFKESDLIQIHDEITYDNNPLTSVKDAKQYLNQKYGNPFTIKKVIFNDPAVIILWADGSKTVVKCSENDIFDPEKGLAMAISKKALGNQGNYYNTFKKYLPEEEDIDDFGLHPEASLGYSWIDKAREGLDDLIKSLKKSSSKSDKPEEKDEDPHLCSNCKYLCQHFTSTACYGCGPNKKYWEPAELEGE